MVDYKHSLKINRKKDEDDDKAYHIRIMLENQDDLVMKINHFVVYLLREDQEFDFYNIRTDEVYKDEIERQEYVSLKPGEKISKEIFIRSRGKPKFSHRLDFV